MALNRLAGHSAEGKRFFLILHLLNVSCNRRSSSFPDEAPADIPASAQQWLAVPPGLPFLSDSAQSHHRPTFRPADADRSSASTGRTHSAKTDWPPGD